MIGSRGQGVEVRDWDLIIEMVSVCRIALNFAELMFQLGCLLGEIMTKNPAAHPPSEPKSLKSLQGMYAVVLCTLAAKKFLCRQYCALNMKYLGSMTLNLEPFADFGVVGLYYKKK